MARRHPGNPLLRVGDHVREALARDAQHARRLIRWIRERVQPVRPFGEVDHLSGRELLLPFRSANGRRSAEDEEHFFQPVVHVQAISWRSRQKLGQRRAEHVRPQWVPKPAAAHPVDRRPLHPRARLRGSSGGASLLRLDRVPARRSCRLDQRAGMSPEAGRVLRPPGFPDSPGRCHRSAGSGLRAQRRASSNRGSSRTAARSSSLRACLRNGGNSSTDRRRWLNVSSSMSPASVEKHA